MVAPIYSPKKEMAATRFQIAYIVFLFILSPKEMHFVSIIWEEVFMGTLQPNMCIVKLKGKLVPVK